MRSRARLGLLIGGPWGSKNPLEPVETRGLEGLCESRGTDGLGESRER